jgi:hypothetical protein
MAAIRPTELDGEQAVERARRIAAAVGVRRELVLHSLARVEKGPYEPAWSVWFKINDEHGFVNLSLKTGLPVQIQFPRKVDRPRGGGRPTKESVDRAWRTIRALGYGESVRLDSSGGFTSTPDTAYFYVLRHGLPFFSNNPLYAHMLWFNDERNEVEFFTASPEPPPVNAWKPKVSRADALAKLRSWYEPQMLAKGLGLALARQKPGVELGYWKFRNEATARLVWRMRNTETIEGLPYSDSPNIVVDALTGELFEPDKKVRQTNAWLPRLLPL